MKSLAILLALSLGLSGCGGLVAAAAYKDLSPEQIDAVGKSGSTLTSCLSVGGPPVGGKTTMIVVPKNAKGKIVLAPDCSIQSGEIVLGGE